MGVLIKIFILFFVLVNNFYIFNIYYEDRGSLVWFIIIIEIIFYRDIVIDFSIKL